jgi:prepilin-type processing-associated H-X9-DG protein
MSYRGDFVAGVHNATPWSPPCWTRSKRYSTWPQPKKYEIQEKVSKETRYRIQYKKVVSRQTRFVWQNKTTYETRYRTEYVTHYKTKHVRKRSKELISSSYSINAWAQEGNPLAESKREQFYFRWELGNCETPAFTEGIWADVMPRPTDKAPSTLYGEDDGMSRICINRYGNYANNVAFFDGSVRSVKLRDLWALPWYRGWKAPDKLPQLPSR